MDRRDFILKLIQEFNYTSYLEIGCRDDFTFGSIPISKIGVDPISGGTLRTTSDEYFKSLPWETKFDIIFIDGLHLCEHVERDIVNSVNHLNTDGVIVIHDANPQHEIHQIRTDKPVGTWNGDVWKAVVNVRQNHNLDLHTANIDHGCCVIRIKDNVDPLDLNKPYRDLTWNELVTNRQRWLRLETPEEVIGWLKKCKGEKPRPKLAAILPHLQQFGGVRRFIEIGNEFISRGYNFTIFSQMGCVPHSRELHCSWIDFRGNFRNWDNIEADYILIGDPPSFPILSKVKGKIIVYVISNNAQYLGSYQGLYDEKKHIFIVNNRKMLKYFPDAILVEGGVNTSSFTHKKIKVMYYDRADRGAYVRQQLSNLPNIELIGLAGKHNKDLNNFYKTADYFVSWETEGGWSNTSAEALACGISVVTNGINCDPFIDKVIVVKDLRKFFENPMEEFSWKNVVNKIERIIDLK